MRIVAFLGPLDATGRVTRDTLIENAEEFGRYGVQFLPKVPIMQGVADGRRFEQGRISKIAELSPEHIGLNAICLRNPNFFGETDSAISSDRHLFPLSGTRARNLEHALADFDLDVVLCIAPITTFAQKNTTFRGQIEPLSRTELLALSWRDVILDICEAMPTSKITLTTDFALPAIFDTFLGQTFPGIPDVGAFANSHSFRDLMGEDLKYADVLPDLLNNRGRAAIKAGIFIEIFSNGSAEEYMKRQSFDLGMHESVIFDSIEGFFQDLEDLSNVGPDNLNIDLLLG